MQITLEMVSLYKLIPKSHGNSLISVPIRSNHTSSNKTTITHIAEFRHTKYKNQSHNQSQILLIQFASHKHDLQNQKNKSKNPNLSDRSPPPLPLPAASRPPQLVHQHRRRRRRPCLRGTAPRRQDRRSGGHSSR